MHTHNITHIYIYYIKVTYVQYKPDLKIYSTLYISNNYIFHLDWVYVSHPSCRIEASVNLLMTLRL